MCLGIPGKVVEIVEGNGLRMGKVDFGGALRECCLEYVPEVEIGDYVIVHVGFAISRLSEQEAQASLEALSELLEGERQVGAGAGEA